MHLAKTFMTVASASAFRYVTAESQACVLRFRPTSAPRRISACAVRRRHPAPGTLAHAGESAGPGFHVLAGEAP